MAKVLGIGLPFLSQYGYFQQTWADTVPDRGAEAQKFKDAFWSLLLKRHNLASTIRQGEAAVLAGKWQRTSVAQNGLATVLIVTHEFGNDLYLSWRAFLKRPFARWKIILFAALHLFVAIVPLLWGFFFLSAVVGFIRSNDAFVMFRTPIREFHWDELYALVITVEKVMQETANQLDLNVTLKSATSISDTRPAKQL